MINLVEQIDASCFGNCSGALEVEVNGGTGDLQFSWDKDLPPIPNPSDICADDYLLIVSDANNCKDSMTFSILEPESPRMEAVQIEPVQCCRKECPHV